MKKHCYTTKVLWSQLDANAHMRHSAYADVCAQARLDLLESVDFGMQVFSQLHIGPVLFREELKYMREIHANETLHIHTYLLNAEHTGRKWTFEHEIYRADGVQAALVVVDGAWMNTITRKLASIPKDKQHLLLKIPTK